ncbi:hypothetical protein G5V57_09455 [Nordella sp. HKS 07]|uniref:hypothetical protein n=1 Tax=Nordella sp. HKS 07 TaxID=2712222 RepID=UPI0013E13FC8|nr:hypothetical protein [Nordella sp. HKS 07]QIG47922.1 hypothetical protein G5V57_09455 [Nordella sp. HKS 07]
MVSNPTTLADPIFSARLQTEIKKLNLFELLCSAATTKLVDLTAMAAHQRPAVVTVFAILSHLLCRYGNIDVADPRSWASAWERLIGHDALRLTASHDEVAFLQPPTIEPTSQQSIEAADLLLAKVEHEVKQTWRTTAERGLFAIMGSMLRPNVKDHRSSSRIGLTAVLTSNNGALGDEIAHLAAAFDALFVGPAADHATKDHLVWLRMYSPKTAPLSLADLPLPFLDVGRAQRLRAVDRDLFEVWAVPNNTARINADADPWLDDPHTPKVVTSKDAKRYKLARKPFDYRFEHAVLFGARSDKEDVVRPRILDLGQYRVVRLCALGSEQGKTKGYREATYVAARGSSLLSFDEPSEADRPARLSRRALETIETGLKILNRSLIELFKEADEPSDVDWNRIDTVRQTFRSTVAPRSIQFVFDALSRDEDIAMEQRSLDQLVAEVVFECFKLAATALANPLKHARAEDKLMTGIRFQLKGAAMNEQKVQPLLARQTYAILSKMMLHLSPDDRARLRTMSLSDPPLSFWKLMAQVPAAHTENKRCLEVWQIVLRTVGRVYHASRPLGRILRETDFPEHRLSRFLVATGSSLPGLLDELARWLVSHEVDKANLADLATVGLGDALDDHDARDWARRSIALQYVGAPIVSSVPARTSEATVGGED